MDQPFNPSKSHIHHHRHGNHAPIITAAAIVILIAVAIGYLALTWHGTPTVTTNQSFSVQNGQSIYFRLKNNPDTFALFLQNSSNSYSIIYVSKVPVLTSPIITFGLASSQSVNISAEGSSQNADLQVKLISSTNKSATIELISIPSIFTIKLSSGIQVRNPASFYTPNNATQPIVITQSPAVQNKTSNKTTATVTTPVTPKNTTTTPKNVTTTPQQPKVSGNSIKNISSILNATYIGTLMNEYKTLYNKDKACDSQTYGTDLQTNDHYAPIGPFDYANASASTPTDVTVNATMLSKTNYAVRYYIVTPSAVFTKPSVAFNLSTSSGVVTNIVFAGAYLDQNYTSLNQVYNFQNGIANDCGAYIPYVP
jgi:hypothetical protein